MPHDEDIKYMLGRLEGKVDSLIAGMKQQTQELQEHEKRIRILETSKAWVLGWSSAAALLISVIIQFLFKGN
mgnify:FL=1|tara:strand:- start:2004 stop:2219 length:216 start_codon:yes stop_codon:yes gene_type:complete